MKYENKLQEKCKHTGGIYLSDGPRCKVCHTKLVWVQAKDLVEVEEDMQRFGWLLDDNQISRSQIDEQINSNESD